MAIKRQPVEIRDRFSEEMGTIEIYLHNHGPMWHEYFRNIPAYNSALGRCGLPTLPNLPASVDAITSVEFTTFRARLQLSLGALRKEMDERYEKPRDDRSNDLDYLEEHLWNLESFIKIADPVAVVNIHRLGFILLMTAFDSAIFDLVRVALENNFFKLIDKFGRLEKITLADLASANNFEDFRDQLIEKQLKSLYLKDLLFVLEKLQVQCVDPSQDDRFFQLIELVLRRNLHVHNRGIVDERYLERDNNGQHKFNLYDLKLGAIARIDSEYWELANRLCTFCVSAVASWAEEMAMSKKM